MLYAPYDTFTMSHKMMKHLSILWLLLLAAVGQIHGKESRPNILFIMSDDHTAQAVGAYATVLKDLNPTPTIDTLAEEGIVFDNAFCVNAIYVLQVARVSSLGNIPM